MKKINSQTIVALKHALSNIYWYKNDLKSFLFSTLKSKQIINAVNWNETKIDCVSHIVDNLIRNEEKIQEEILDLIEQVCNFNIFLHFDALPNGYELKSKAKLCVIELRQSCQGWLDEKKDKEAKAKVFVNHQQAIKKSKDFQNQLDDFKNEYYFLSQLDDFQKRGFLFEKFLNELFAFYDLDPRGSFKIIGEQIDGSFTHEGTDYLIEAKWTTSLIERNDLDIFSGKISRKLKNALGLFISINGFTEVLIKNNFEFHDMILMDSQDLIKVLENRIQLSDLIRLKRKHASETGEIMHRVDC